MKKYIFYTELSYISGIIVLAFGTALMEAADFGVSMVVAPAYLLYRKLSQLFPFFTFGMAEYTLQAFLLLLMILVLRQFKISYLFSFVTTILYGLALDLSMLLIAFFPTAGIPARLILYIVGLPVCSLGVSLLFHTYFSPAVYELSVKESAAKFRIPITVFKTGFDCVFCLIAVLMSFLFFGFGHFEVVKAGTILCALVNGWTIGKCTVFLEKRFEFRDGLPLRRFFEK